MVINPLFLFHPISMALFGGTSAVDEKNREISQLRKDYETDARHKRELQEMKDSCKTTCDNLKEAQRNDTQELKDRIKELEASYERQENKTTQVGAELKYEQENREKLVQAEVQKALGQYETRYYHDLHTFMEEHTTKFNNFQQGFMDKTLAVIKELKPQDAKVMILGKEVFGADAKAAQGEKKKEGQ